MRFHHPHPCSNMMMMRMHMARHWRVRPIMTPGPFLVDCRYTVEPLHSCLAYQYSPLPWARILTSKIPVCGLLYGDELHISECIWSFQPIFLSYFGENAFLLFSNGVDFHPALLFQEVLSWYLWNDRSTLKIEESRLQLFFNSIGSGWVLPKF